MHINMHACTQTFTYQRYCHTAGILIQRIEFGLLGDNIHATYVYIQYIMILNIE